MTTKIPLPPLAEIAINKDRAVSGLLKAQILHLHEAERRLPTRHHTDIYVNAIKTEGEAAEYIRRVTEAIHEAHANAAAKRERGIAIAAAAEKPTQKPKSPRKAKGRRSPAKSRRTK